MEIIFWILGVIYILSIIGCRKCFQEDFTEGKNRQTSGINYFLVTFCPVFNTIAVLVLMEYSSLGHGAAEWFFKSRKIKSGKNR